MFTSCLPVKKNLSSNSEIGYSEENTPKHKSPSSWLLIREAIKLLIGASSDQLGMTNSLTQKSSFNHWMEP